MPLGVDVRLRELLESVGSSYDRDLGRDQPAVRLLASAGDHLAAYVPVTHIVKGSTGVGGLPVVPWVAILDPDETITAQRGMYLVYLLTADTTTVYLSLNQGSDDLRNARRTSKRGKVQLSVPQQLQRQADFIRNRLKLRSWSGVINKIDLRAPRHQQRPRNYEAGNIVAKSYDLKKLPSDNQLRQDLDNFLNIYDHALDVRQRIALSEPDVIVSRQPVVSLKPSEDFKPTDGSDYYVRMSEREEWRSRKHVPLLAAFARHLEQLGCRSSNQRIHPRDLTFTKDAQHWLVELKVVRRGDGQEASRQAVAQLLEYRRFCYAESERSAVRLLAVFSENIGPAFVEHLESLDIAVVWADGQLWGGSKSAVAAGLC